MNTVPRMSVVVGREGGEDKKNSLVLVKLWIFWGCRILGFEETRLFNWQFRAVVLGRDGKINGET